MGGKGSAPQDPSFVQLILENLPQLLLDYLEGLVLIVALVSETLVLLDKVVNGMRRHHPISAFLFVK